MFSKAVRVVFVLFVVIIITMTSQFKAVTRGCSDAMVRQQRVSQAANYTLLESGNAMPNVVLACMATLKK